MNSRPIDPVSSVAGGDDTNRPRHKGKQNTQKKYICMYVSYYYSFKLFIIMYDTFKAIVLCFERLKVKALAAVGVRCYPSRYC
jgi:hypothetical protein